MAINFTPLHDHISVATRRRTGNNLRRHHHSKQRRSKSVKEIRAQIEKITSDYNREKKLMVS
jgi:hypothetical protein